MNKFILHLGPPKTATTSFQLFFQNLECSELEYLGIKQIRGNFNNTFSVKLYDHVVGKTQELNIRIRLIATLL